MALVCNNVIVVNCRGAGGQRVRLSGSYILGQVLNSKYGQDFYLSEAKLKVLVLLWQSGFNSSAMGNLPYITSYWYKTGMIVFLCFVLIKLQQHKGNDMMMLIYNNIKV